MLLGDTPMARGERRLYPIIKIRGSVAFGETPPRRKAILLQLRCSVPSPPPVSFFSPDPPVRVYSPASFDRRRSSLCTRYHVDFLLLAPATLARDERDHVFQETATRSDCHFCSTFPSSFCQPTDEDRYRRPPLPFSTVFFTR